MLLLLYLSNSFEYFGLSTYTNQTTEQKTHKHTQGTLRPFHGCVAGQPALSPGLVMSLLTYSH